MLRAAVWQYHRHIEKQEYIHLLNQRLSEPVLDIIELLKNPDTDWTKLLNRRVVISGEFDFKHEIVISNRRHNDTAGKHVITPLKIDGTEKYILVNRGFIPYKISQPENRLKFQNPHRMNFVGLLKEPSHKVFFLQPSDPSPQPGKFFDDWLRVDIDKISLQTPYKLLPLYAEIMNTAEHEEIVKQIVRSSSDKTAMLFLPARASSLELAESNPTEKLPIPVFDTVIPPGRHYGYIWEWSFMALATLLIGIIIQLKRH